MPGMRVPWLSDPHGPDSPPGHCSWSQKPHSALTFSPLTGILPSLCSLLASGSDFSMPHSGGPLLSLPQGFQNDPFYHLSTYLCLSLVAAQFVLSCLVDHPPFFPEDPQQSVSCRASSPVPPLSLFYFWSRSPCETEGSETKAQAFNNVFFHSFI